MATISGPAWMEGVRERDALFGLPPTKIEDTETWGSLTMMCANDTRLAHPVYRVPGFLGHLINHYAERDGWRNVNGRMICPICASVQQKAEGE